MIKQKPKIMIEEDTKLILDGCKIHNRETYDDIVKRLVENQLNKEQINKILTKK